MSSLSTKSRGRLVAIFGVLCISPDALCMRFLSLAGTEVFAILAWKFFFVFIFLGFFTIALSGGVRPLVSGLFQAGWYVIPTVLVQAIGNITYTLAMVNTSAANALLLLNMNVLWAAVFGCLCLGERLELRTKLATLCALAAVSVISLAPALTGESSEGGPGNNPLLGDGLALAAGMCWAGFITFVRYVGKKAPKAKMSAAGALGSGMCAVIGAGVQGFDGLLPSANGFHGPAWHFFCVVGADALCVSGVLVAASLAPALIPGPEVAAILLLEVLLSPLWIFLAFHVTPSLWTLLGGSLLLCTLMTHELLPMLAPQGARSCWCRRRAEVPSVKKQVDVEAVQDIFCSGDASGFDKFRTTPEVIGHDTIDEAR